MVAGESSLHKNLSLRKWHDAADDLQTEKGQNAIRETHRGEYPLLIACERNAPKQIILTLLREYPEAASKQSNSGNLPLHHACQLRPSIDIITALIEAYPEGLDVQNKMKITPRYYRQKEKNVTELLTRPTKCWIDQVKQDSSNRKKLEQIAVLREMKWQLGKEMETHKSTTTSYAAQLDETETLANSLRVNKEKIKLLEENFVRIKERFQLELSSLKEKVQQAEKTIREENWSNEEKREESKFQYEYVEKAINMMHELEQDIETSETALRLVKIECDT